MDDIPVYNNGRNVTYILLVTKDLNDYVSNGQYFPAMPRRASKGMKLVENRRKILQCFQVFKKFVDELELTLGKHRCSRL